MSFLSRKAKKNKRASRQIWSGCLSFAMFSMLMLCGCLSLANAQTVSEPLVKVSVTDAAGTAVQGAQVKALSSKSGQRCVTDEKGTCALPVMPGSISEIEVNAAGFARARQSVAGATVAIMLQPAGLNDTVTVTPARTEQRLSDLPASVSVLERKDVVAAAAQTVDDLLRQVPGFSIFRRTSSLVANPTTQGVSLRGTGASGASRTLVLQDGVPLNDAFGGWVYWSRIARPSIQQVELVRGGASDLYGSDALSGVINVISRPLNARHAEAEISGGNRATLDGSFYLSDVWRKFGVSLTGEIFDTDGYFIVAPERRGLADDAAASKHRNLGLRMQYKIHEGASWFLRGTLFDDHRRNGTLLQVNDTATEGLATGARWQTRDGSEWQATVFAHQQRYHQTFSAVAANRNSETLNRQQFVPARDAGLSFNWSRPFASSGGVKHLLLAGADVRGVRGTSDETVIAAGRATTFASSGGRQRRAGVFIQDILQLTSKLSLTASLRFDTWRDSSGGIVDRTLATGAVRARFIAPRTAEAFNPRLALSYALNSRVSLKAAGYRAFRAPTLNELYRSFRVGDTLTQANERLVAERLTGGELGTSITLNSRAIVRLTGFWMETVNPVANFTLSATPTLITRERRNLGRTRSAGIEAESDWQVTPHWQFSAGYLYVAATVRQAPQDALLIGLAVPQVPRQQFTLQTTYANPRWLNASLQFRAVGSQFDDDRNQLPLGRFGVVDATVSRRLHRWVEAFVAAQNLLNQRYQVARTPLENVGMPRLWRGGVRFTLE